MSVVYRDRDRYDDSRSVASARTTGGTKVTRYVVKEDDYDSRSRYEEPRASRYEDTRSRYDDNRTSYSRFDPQEPKYSRETITIRRDESPQRRDDYWNRPAGDPVEDRELVIRRTVERDSGTRDVAPTRQDNRAESVALTRVDDRRESRYSDYEMVSSPKRAVDEREREVQRYIRTSEYYQPPPAPQPPQTIIIRQEPIIIRERERERPREEEFQIVKKSDIEEEKPISRQSKPRDEEYFYEKRVRERLPEDERGERRLTRKEVSPHDSVSQAGARRRYSDSDDSMVYVRKEKVTEDYGSDDEDHRKRDLAIGAVAGIGAAELIRNHHAKEGKETSHGAGRAAKGIGAGIVGAVAAEGIRRYRSKSRKRGSRSRSGSRDRGRYSGRDSRRRSRSRSESNSNLKTFGGVLAAAAAVAAGAAIASRSKKDASPERSRSRRRHGSRSRSRSSAISEAANNPNATDERNPKVRNKRSAAVGAIGAAAAALYERHRSKSRGRASSGSPNRFKQAAPIVGTGLAAYGLAHMYESRKGKEEAREQIQDENRGRRHRSRSRSTVRTYHDGPKQASYSEPGLIQYGTEPLQGNNYGEGYYGRPGVESDYYNNPNQAIVPAPAPPPAAPDYAGARRERPRSASRTRSLSSGSDRRSHSRRRSKSRDRFAGAAAAAGVGVAASELNNRRKKRHGRERRKSRDESYADNRSRTDSYTPYTAGRDPYEDANWHATHSQSYAQGMYDDPYASQSGFQSQFPPPPGSMPQQGYAPQQAYAPQQPPNQTYTPQNFPPPPQGAPQQQYNAYAPNQNPYAPRGAEDNVSAGNPSSAPTDQHQPVADGIKPTMATSPPIVGSNLTVQRPSTNTLGAAPPVQFPGSTASPFQRTNGTSRGLDSSSDPSPGTQDSGVATPLRPSSRAATTYTPTLPLQHQERDRSTATQPVPRSADGSTAHDVATSTPNPRQYTDIPADSRVTKTRQPEMVQTNRSTPFMPSPDLRPPSDRDLPAQPYQPWPSFNPNENAPSMPQLVVPEQPQSYDLPQEERRARERSRSRSPPRSAPQTDGVSTNTRARSQSAARKSVSFNPHLDFSDAPSPASREGRTHNNRRDRDRRGYEAGDDFSDETPAEDQRRRSHDREREKEREKDRDRERGARHNSRRQRSSTQSLDQESGSAQDGDRDRDRERDRRRDSRRANTDAGSGRNRRDRDVSPAGSDTTIDLPQRFDESGRPKRDSYGDGERSPEQDVLAGMLDQILGGFGGGTSKKW